ncbi:hypothetical protein [Capnocytophaga sp.]|uniref:hypothetical protein n=1 Tax=Capnocytophaga sp. TaxID=44737 RepID=UPI0026DCEAE2|nr:hypothetical protein [Capnocytophaga sp.]MDO5106538.1 hypothetical protein [Capnocytophaga sp.]
MNLIETYNYIEKLPVIIDFDEEIFLIKKIFEVSDDEIRENKIIFIDIIKKIELSHIDNGIFFVDENNYPLFKEFSIWLDCKNQTTNVGIPIPIIESFLAKIY